MPAPDPARRPAPIRSRRRARRLLCGRPQAIADGVWVVRGGLGRTMNAYLVREPGGGVLVFDTGEKGMAGGIAEAAAGLGGITRIVLGHGDTDHRGSAPALRASADVDVLCHPDAVAQAEGSGGRDYHRPAGLPPGVRLLHAVAHPHVWDGGPVHVDGTVRAGDELAGFGVIDLPGHAPGQIGLWRERDRVALVSDCVYLVDMLGRPQAPAVPVDAYNHDTERARRSILDLAALRPAIVAPGHLGPMTGPGVVADLQAAARR